MDLTVKGFYELTLDELFEIYKFRAAVFIVEQNCVYQDVDEWDKSAYHLFLKENGEMQAYLRVLPSGTAFDDISIGRVITAKRRCGLGTRIMNEGIKVAKEKFNAKSITIKAQLYAKKFYERFGFKEISEAFSEDGILHVEMKAVF
ncbi:MAG: GNAT family N-acetyltransferase [Firmicutes bacterium]|nr:GNAT family N-acetyltransferase [[Eubacterium] siraeum]MCM1487821.1 GNAT family N-acetyltransferase [Bacillota bacterium]